MATIELNLPFLSSYLEIPETSFTTLLTSPTIDLVKNLLISVATTAHQHERIRSEKLKLDIELENVVRAAESKARVLKSSVEKALQEAADVRQKLQEEEIVRQSLESELYTLKSFSSSSTTELSDSRARIASLESSNRDTLSLLESKATALDNLAAELSAKQQKTVELRHDISTLEQKVRSSDAASSTAKFREQSLQSEVDSLKRSNDWLEQELKAKSAEHSKFRRDKNARLAELQRTNEEATSTVEVLQRSEHTLKLRLEEIMQKADDFLGQIQQLKEEATRQQEDAETQIDRCNRLVELYKKSAETEKERHQDVSSQLEQARDDAAAEIGRINAELETEHQDKIAAEHKVAELEVQLERLQADTAIQGSHHSRPATPNRMLNGSISGTPGRDNSPSRLLPSSLSRVVGGLSMTQMITDYHTAKAELEFEKRRNEQLSATVDDMIQEMENRQPEVVDLQADHDRLEADVLEMSQLVDSVGLERDKALKDARNWEGQVSGLIKESDILRQQLRDLSSQVKVLLMEVHAKDQNLDNYTPEERLRLERLARGEVEDEMAEDITATDRFITQHLTTFHSVAALQEQNQKLLRITHELGHKLEGEEAQREKTQASQNQEELEDLRQKYERCRDEIRSLVTQSQSYIRERDMFRRMLAHRGQLPTDGDLASLFGESANGDAGTGTPSQSRVVNSIELSPSSRDMADYAKLLKEMQSHFDTYRQEAATDRSTLKEQVDNLSKKNTELRSEVSRRSNEVTLAHERYEMLQGNYAMLRNENNELQRRTQNLSEKSATQDLKTQQVAEDLVEAKVLLESMRNEIGNLKAEKEFWKNVEKRLVDDNQYLTNERDRLNTLNANIQNLANEREQSDREAQRKLQAKMESMEIELQSLKRKLGDEMEESKRAALRRELDNKQSQTRIDDLVTSLGSVREELVATKTGRDHLQARVDEMTIELRSVEERLAVLQSQPSVSANGVENDQPASLSIEQDLAMQVSELKRDLELTSGELANAKAQVDQYKAISQSVEEELQSLNETQDQYRQEMDGIIEEKESKIRETQDTVEALRTEITDTNSEVISLRSENSDGSRKLQEQKILLEAEIANLKDLKERSDAAAHYYQEDLKGQVEIAQKAQQDYDNELVKHAEAAKNLQKLRAEHVQLRQEIVELKVEAESARKLLVQGEESWLSTRDRYEHELSELRIRREDAIAQNKLLHQQLEAIGKQVNDLQQRRTLDLEEVEGSGGSASPAASTENWQEIVRYVRREKEIVDVQWGLSTQAAKRLEQQLKYTQSQLDDARLKLNQQRHAEENSERNAIDHNKLMDTINELNLNRESNVALRLEKNQAQASLTEKLKTIDELQGKIQPLQAKVRELEDIKEAQEEDLRMTREARERFEQRYHDVLHKSDAIDPAEVESLKEQIKILEIERDELLASRDSLQRQVDAVPDEIKQSLDQANERFQESRQKLIDQSKAKARDQNNIIREKNAALQTAAQEKEELEAQLRATREELDTAKLARDEVLAAQPPMSSNTTKIDQPVGSEDGQVNEGEKIPSNVDAVTLALQEKLDEAESRADEEAIKATQLQDTVSAIQLRVDELESQISILEVSLSQANSEILRLENQEPEREHLPTSTQPPESGSNEQVEELRQELEQAQNNLETLRTAASINNAASAVQTNDDSPSVAEQINAQVEEIRVELTKRHDERVRQAEETFQKRADVMKGQLIKRLAEGRATIRQEAIDELVAQHQKELELLETRHRDELDELRRNEETRFEQFKQSSHAEHLRASAGDAPLGVTEGVQAPQDGKKWEPTETQIKDLIASNDIVKGIMKKNIISHINKERESLTAKVQEEQQKIMDEKLADADSKAKEAQLQAVNMEGTKNKLKISMAENRARSAQVKIEYVSKAAAETPAKPVSEVWAIAKDLRPPPNAPQKLQPPSTHTQPQGVANPFALKSTTSITPMPLISSLPTNPSQKTQPQTTFGLPTPVQSQPIIVSAPESTEVLKSNHVTEVSDSTQSPAAETMSTNNVTTITQQSLATNGVQPQTTGQQISQPPEKPLQAHAGRGIDPPTFRGNQSNLPLPNGGRGGLGQSIHSGDTVAQQNQSTHRGGSGIARGRGRGIGRGGIPQVQTTVPNPGQQTQSSSPRGGPMSATARQFVPQAQKRKGDDGLEASQHAGGVKRARGGLQGGG